MSEPLDLESLYAQAQAALKAKDYACARDLLKQIVMMDETYRDASRLLANLVAQQRRRWYNDARLWGAVGVVALIALGVFVASQLPALMPRAAETPMAIALAPTATAMRVAPTTTPTPLLPVSIPTDLPWPTKTLQPLPTATAVPLAWKRISMGQEFSRDYVSAIAVDPRDPEVFYVSLDHAGIYKTLDAGTSWQPAHNGLGHGEVKTLIVDPQDPRTLYTGVSLDGVYKTTDGGSHWRPVNQGIQGGWEWISIVVMDPLDNRHLFYTHSHQVFESVDGGATWSEIRTSACPASIVALAIHPTNSKILFAVAAQDEHFQCKDGGVYKSQDGGRTWQPTNLIGSASPNDLLVIDRQKGNVLFATLQGDLYGSLNGGSTWSRMESSCASVAIARDNSAVVYCVQSDEVRKSTDGGRTWQALGEIGKRTTSIALSPHSPDTLLLGGAGMWISSDGGKTWQVRNSGLPGNQFELYLDPANSSILYAGESGLLLHRSTNRGTSWEVFETEGNGLAFDAAGKFLYRNGGEKILRSADSGKTWTISALPYHTTWRIAAHPRQPSTLYALYGRDHPPYIYISLDAGNTWQKATGMQSICDPTLYFDHDQGSVVYAIGDMDAFRSRDGGRTWEPCARLDVWYSRAESRLAIDPRNSDKIIIATRGNGVMISNDGCKTWQTSNWGLGGLFVNTLAVDLKNPDRVYAGTDGGAYVSFDSGKSWSAINDGLLGALVVYSIVVDPRDSSVYAATPYGVFKLEAR